MPAQARRGARLGVDVGSVRVGVAACDPDGILAFPLATLARDAEAEPRTGEAAGTPKDMARLRELVAEHSAMEVVVGLPRSLDGGEGPAAEQARGYARVLAKHIAPVPVRLLDERMTTVDAHRNLRASGVAGRAQRRVVDQAAAVLILQAALDAERQTGAPPGEPATTTRRKPRRKGTTS